MSVPVVTVRVVALAALVEALVRVVAEAPVLALGAGIPVVRRFDGRFANAHK